MPVKPAETPSPDAAAKSSAGDGGAAVAQPWELRIWNGMNFGGWMRLLVRNRFAVSPSRIGMALVISALSLFNSAMWLLQMLFYGRKIARTDLVDDPIFVVGHWRSGTTLLHELLAADPRHTYPNTYACFGPNHFLLTENHVTWWLRYLLPKRRPMDNMEVSWQAPQEDEWALCNMGLPSPYLSLAFFNRPPQCAEYLDLRQVPPADLARWKEGLLWFLKCLTVQKPKRIVLKTPQHTCRIRTLLEMFPKARFVHIVRNPYELYPSTIKTWKRMSSFHGLQVPRCVGLEEQVFRVFEHMYEVFEEDRKLIGAGQFCQVRYEELVRDPIGQMQQVYAALGLDRFELVRPALDEYVSRTAGYRPNRHQLDPQLRQQINRRWRAYFDNYDYARDESAAPTGSGPDSDLQQVSS